MKKIMLFLIEFLLNNFLIILGLIIIVIGSINRNPYIYANGACLISAGYTKKKVDKLEKEHLELISELVDRTIYLYKNQNIIIDKLKQEFNKHE